MIDVAYACVGAYIAGCAVGITATTIFGWWWMGKEDDDFDNHAACERCGDYSRNCKCYFRHQG